MHATAIMRDEGMISSQVAVKRTPLIVARFPKSNGSGNRTLSSRLRCD
jgi:hypothetical protein